VRSHFCQINDFRATVRKRIPETDLDICESASDFEFSTNRQETRYQPADIKREKITRGEIVSELKPAVNSLTLAAFTATLSVLPAVTSSASNNKETTSDEVTINRWIRGSIEIPLKTEQTDPVSLLRVEYVFYCISEQEQKCRLIVALNVETFQPAEIPQMF